MANLNFPSPLSQSYIPKDQRQAIANAGINNALLMAGISLLGAPPTPYRQTFGQNLAQGLGAGLGAFNQTLAGAQEQALKNRQITMQEDLNKSQKALKDIMIAKEKDEMKRMEEFRKAMESRTEPTQIMTGYDLSGKKPPEYTTYNKTVKPTLADMLQAAISYDPIKGTALIVEAQKPVEWKPLTEESAIRFERAKRETKEVSGGNDMENFLGRLPQFSGFYNNQKIRTDAYNWLATPEGNAAWEREQKRLAGIAQLKYPPIYNVIPGYQTETGQPVVISGRTGRIQGSDKLQKTPMESDIKFERDYKSASALIDEIAGHFSKIEPKMAKGATERLLKAPLIAGEALSQSDTLLTSTKAITEAALSKLIRALGEVGTLTDADVARARNTMPSIYDTVQVKNQKIKQLRELLDEVYNRGSRFETTAPMKGEAGLQNRNTVGSADDFLNKYGSKKR